MAEEIVTTPEAVVRGAMALLRDCLGWYARADAADLRWDGGAKARHLLGWLSAGKEGLAEVEALRREAESLRDAARWDREQAAEALAEAEKRRRAWLAQGGGAGQPLHDLYAVPPDDLVRAAQACASWEDAARTWSQWCGETFGVRDMTEAGRRIDDTRRGKNAAERRADKLAAVNRSLLGRCRKLAARKRPPSHFGPRVADARALLDMRRRDGLAAWYKAHGGKMTDKWFKAQHDRFGGKPEPRPDAPPAPKKKRAPRKKKAPPPPFVEQPLADEIDQMPLITAHGGKVPVAEILRPLDDEDGPAEGHYDAALIAAAPELLAACAAFLACPPRDRHDMHLEEIVEAAVRKAKGA